MHQVIASALSRRLVTLVGHKGVGKTSVAVAVATYLSQRSVFRRGVCWVSVAGSETASGTRQGTNNTRAAPLASQTAAAALSARVLPLLERRLGQLTTSAGAGTSASVTAPRVRMSPARPRSGSSTAGTRKDLLLVLDGCEALCTTRSGVQALVALLNTVMASFAGVTVSAQPLFVHAGEHTESHTLITVVAICVLRVQVLMTAVHELQSYERLPQPADLSASASADSTLMVALVRSHSAGILPRAATRQGEQKACRGCWVSWMQSWLVGDTVVWVRSL